MGPNSSGMKQAQKKFALVAAAFAFGLAGCGGWGASNAGSSGAATVPFAIDATPSYQIAGMYDGRASDTTLGKGRLVLQLTSSANTGVNNPFPGYGGSLAGRFGSKTLNGIVAVAGSTNLTGNAVALVASPCSFTFQAHYDPRTHKLKGSYGATFRCSGERGSFVAKQQCYYVTGLVPGAIPRPNAGAIKPC